MSVVEDEDKVEKDETRRPYIRVYLNRAILFSSPEKGGLCCDVGIYYPSVFKREITGQIYTFCGKMLKRNFLFRPQPVLVQ